MTMPSSIETTLDRARVLRSETRLEIWCLLDEAGMYVSDIAGTLDIAVSTASYHLAILRSVGLAECTRQGKRRLYTWTPERWAIVSEQELAAAAR